VICYYLEIWDLRCKDSVDIFFFLYFLFYFLFISTKTCSKTITETNLNLNFIFIFLTKHIFIFSIFIFLYRNTHQTQNFLHYWNITSNPFSKKNKNTVVLFIVILHLRLHWAMKRNSTWKIMPKNLIIILILIIIKKI
jgi:hypothetical protein